MRPDRYLLCTGLLLATLLAFALSGGSPVGRVLVPALLGATLLTILWTSRVSRRLLAATAGVVVTAVAVSLVTVTTGTPDESGFPFALTALLALLAPPAIVRRLLAQERIEPSTVFGALCVYLLAGLFFALVYAALDAFGTQPFFAQVDGASPSDFVYFSFVTLATLGYGDLTPADELGRMVAITETMLGQLYLVGVVAVLVSQLGRARTPRPR